MEATSAPEAYEWPVHASHTDIHIHARPFSDKHTLELNLYSAPSYFSTDLNHQFWLHHF